MHLLSSLLLLIYYWLKKRFCLMCSCRSKSWLSLYISLIMITQQVLIWGNLPVKFAVQIKMSGYDVTKWVYLFVWLYFLRIMSNYIPLSWNANFDCLYTSCQQRWFAAILCYCDLVQKPKRMYEYDLCAWYRYFKFISIIVKLAAHYIHEQCTP